MMRSLEARDAWTGDPSMTRPVLRRLIRFSGNPAASAARNRYVIENARGACGEIAPHATAMPWSWCRRDGPRRGLDGSRFSTAAYARTAAPGRLAP